MTERQEQMIYDEGFRRGYEKGKADRPKGEWIPCEERLPSEDGEYLVTWGEGFISAFYYGKPTNYPNKKVKGKCFYEYNDEYGDAVCDDAIAWMPLPKPWKGADDE